MQKKLRKMLSMLMVVAMLMSMLVTVSYAAETGTGVELQLDRKSVV